MTMTFRPFGSEFGHIAYHKAHSTPLLHRPLRVYIPVSHESSGGTLDITTDQAKELIAALEVALRDAGALDEEDGEATWERLDTVLDIDDLMSGGHGGTD